MRFLQKRLIRRIAPLIASTAVMAFAFAAPTCSPTGAGPSSTSPPSPQSQPPPSVGFQMSLVKILLNERLWGPDFPRVLAASEAWIQSGEQTIEVFEDRIVGSTSYETRGEAERATAAIAENLAKPLPRVRPEFARLQADFRKSLPSPTVIQFEDDRFHVSQEVTSAQFLAPGLTIALVREQLGPEEQVVQRLIQNERERRPVILTLHFYARGAIAFTEADIAPAGTVNRVLLNTKAVTNAVFSEAP